MRNFNTLFCVIFLFTYFLGDFTNTEDQWQWLTMRELLRLLTVRKICVEPSQGLIDLGLENILALEIKYNCSEKLVYTDMHDSNYWIIFKEVLAPQLVNLESVSFCNFTGAKG